ncbi:MAG: retroviral-like aspartic protease family protein [Pyrinomonadaceae bacterium]
MSASKAAGAINAFIGGEKSGAHRNAQTSSQLPAAVRFREVEGRGLLVDTWINGNGPYIFAIDTGAGAMILSERIARVAGVAIRRNHAVNVGGASVAGSHAGCEASVRSLAIGNAGNQLSANGFVIVAGRLPADVDGILNPTEAYAPLGYAIDLPRREISAFDPRLTPLRIDAIPAEGAVVSWLSDSESRRPFVALTPGGRRALLDTGSGFGLALSESNAASFGIIPGNNRGERNIVRDLGGGTISARRIDPATVRVGALLLRKVPTDLLSETDAAAPILLGRDALRPFRLRFDPLNRLIEFTPAQ